ncbi:MAG: hypothetical protein Q9195_003748 [Heterodermia aff. obscurata]
MSKAEPGNFQTLLTNLLREHVKPAFVKSNNSAITPAGRKAIIALPPRFEASIDETKSKPWKYGQVYLITVFEWILEQLDLLERTGLGEVFQEALTPCLLYLPELTPEAESLQLLSAVYPTLLSLIRTRFPEARDQRSMQKTLDHLFRYGILKGYAHAGDNVRIAEFLVRRMTDVVNEMGMASCKHLKIVLCEAGLGYKSSKHLHYGLSLISARVRSLTHLQQIVPLLSAVLSDPFATAYPPLLLAALQAIQSVIIIDWSRMEYHGGEILRSLIICWCKILQDEDTARPSSLGQVKAEIKHNIGLLTAVLKRDTDVAVEYRMLKENDGRLEELLAI